MVSALVPMIMIPIIVAIPNQVTLSIYISVFFYLVIALMCFELLYLGYVYFQMIELMVIGAIGVIGPTVL